MITEMIKLINLCAKNNVPFELVEDTFFEKSTPHLYYPSASKAKCSIVCHEFSYGGKSGKLEIMGLSEYFTEDGEPSDDNVIGWLDAEDVFTVLNTDNFCFKFLNKKYFI